MLAKSEKMSDTRFSFPFIVESRLLRIYEVWFGYIKSDLSGDMLSTLMSLTICWVRARSWCASEEWERIHFFSIRGHSLFQGCHRIADIKFTGLSPSLGTCIPVYDVIFPWIIERIIFDKKVAELPIFVVDEYL